MLLVAPNLAHALDLRVGAGFLGPYVSFEPTQPPNEHQQAHLVVYEKEESALLVQDFKYGDAAFAPLHRNPLPLKKILPAQDPDVPSASNPYCSATKRAPPWGPRPSCPSLSQPSAIGLQRG